MHQSEQKVFYSTSISPNSLESTGFSVAIFYRFWSWNEHFTVLVILELLSLNSNNFFPKKTRALFYDALYHLRFETSLAVSLQRKYWLNVTQILVLERFYSKHLPGLLTMATMRGRQDKESNWIRVMWLKIYTEKSLGRERLNSWA